jgi:hypothetical protein
MLWMRPAVESGDLIHRTIRIRTIAMVPQRLRDGGLPHFSQPR